MSEVCMCPECDFPIIDIARDGLCKECWEMKTVGDEMDAEQKRIREMNHCYKKGGKIY